MELSRASFASLSLWRFFGGQLLECSPECAKYIVGGVYSQRELQHSVRREVCPPLARHKARQLLGIDGRILPELERHRVPFAVDGVHPHTHAQQLERRVVQQISNRLWWFA